MIRNIAGLILLAYVSLVFWAVGVGPVGLCVVVLGISIGMISLHYQEKGKNSE